MFIERAVFTSSPGSVGPPAPEEPEHRAADLPFHPKRLSTCLTNQKEIELSTELRSAFRHNQ